MGLDESEQEMLGLGDSETCIPTVIISLAGSNTIPVDKCLGMSLRDQLD